jgi:capsular exopolysaccharide synthesis family protein
MQFLTNGSDDDNIQSLAPRDRDLARFSDAPWQYPTNAAPEDDSASSFNFRRLLRRYWLLVLGLMILGAAGGLASVILSSPRYKTRLLLEVQNPGGSLSKNDTSSDTSEIGIQTQVTLLHSGSFLKRGAERVQSESIPLAPAGKDLFSRIRQRIHPAAQDPLEAYKAGIQTALSSFDARPVIKTRLIELTCESTSPDVAAQFLNAMAREFEDDNNRIRIQTAQKTGEWLAQQIDEAKGRVHDAEDKLQEFVRASGNAFAGQDATLDDTKLAHLKTELSRIQADRIAKQTRYELSVKATPDSLAEVLSDGVLRNYKVQLEDLNREKAKLETVYTPKHEKVRQINAQIAVIQKSYETELNNTLKRTKGDYEAAQRQEKLLSGAYYGQAQRVGSEAGIAAQYAALRREVDTQRQMYQTLLVQQSEVNLSGSVPVNPIRTVESATPPEFPYKPQPVLSISLGTLLGLALTAGLIFLREHTDRSIKEPGISRRLFNAPELGVIPNLGLNGSAVPKRMAIGKGQSNGHEDGALAPMNGFRPQPFVTESFRSTIASILRNQVSGRAQKTILVTSPGPAEGKTTVVQNLGVVLAETGRKVLLVDADFRRPHLHRKFGLPNEWGLIDLLCEDRPIDEYVPEQIDVPTGIPGLSILPNRVTQHNVAKVLYSPRLRTILESLVDRYDMVLVDAPPILSIADARIIAPLTDGLILVLRCGVTDREAAVAAYQRIQEDGLSLLGTVLTDYDASSDRKHQYYYQYGDVR